MRYSKWIKIDKEILCSANIEEFRELLRLLSKKVNDQDFRFNFFIPIDPTQIETHPNFAQLSIIEKDFIKRSILKAYNSGAKNNPNYYVEEGNFLKYEFNKFTLTESIYFFNQTFMIFVENDLYDKYFLKAVFRNFDESNRIMNYIREGFVVFQFGGGIDGFVNTIKSKLEEISEIRYLNGGFPQKYINAFVVCDSDKKYPGEVIQKNIKMIADLNVLGVSCHMLEKRSMENYLPDDIFNELANNNIIHSKRWVNVYKNITSHQKDHLKYDKGFGRKKGNHKKLRTEHLQAIQNLYSSISDVNYDILDDGIQLASYKSNFADLFKSPLIHKEILLKRAGGTDDENELKLLVHKVNNVL